MEFTTEHRQVILTAGERYRALLASEPPSAWRTWDVERRAEQLEHGVPYSSAEWFDCGTDAERMRFQRAIADLERHGVIVCWRRFGRRLTAFRLTALGEQIERVLLVEEQERIAPEQLADIGGGI